MTTAPKIALERLKALGVKADLARSKADVALAARDAQALVTYEAGWRRADVALAIGVTPDRIDQVLRRERNRAAPPIT